MLVETVFRYRTLLGKCDLGVGLDWDEIEEISELEQMFAPDPSEARSGRGRRFRRVIIKADGFIRGDRINDPLEIVEIGPGGLVCRKAPYIARGEEVEITIDCGAISFRFCARGVWLRDDGEDFRVGMAFIGTPVALHRVALSAHQEDVVDHIAAAA